MNEIIFHNKAFKMSIQTKLIAIILITSTVVFSGYIVFHYITNSTAMRDELHDLSGFLAKQLAESLKQPVWDLSTESIKGILHSAMLEKQVYSIVVKNSRERVIGNITRDSNWNIVMTGQEHFDSGNVREKEILKKDIAKQDMAFGDKKNSSMDVCSNQECIDAGCFRKEDIIWKDKKIGSVEVTLSHIFMQKKITQNIIELIIIVIIKNVIVICVLLISIRKILVIPLKWIVGSVRTIASGQMDIELLNDRNDEIGQLALDVNRMRLAIKKLTENLTEQERLKNEMALARRIQTSLLPVLTDNFHPDLQIAASMITAEQVGGDFYDITYDKTGNLWFAIGDVSGHGVTPGLIMMMAQTAHTTVTTNFACDAQDVVIMINEILYKNVHERLRESNFMTFNALKYLGKGKFQHSGAHLRIIVYRQQSCQCELIKTKGVYLNFKKDISKVTKNFYFQLGEGDIMVLYTDGLTEAENTDKKMLDIKGLMKIVKKYALQESETMKENIMADVLQWCNYKIKDDMTLLIVKRK
ncbi:MAG: SpoIIE family protein phosphatase [Desulfamplus sp.]|nr:SpoIIE family protein phosphatase [Desulfamplus sp.]